MPEITIYLSTIILNVNSFNSPNKRHILADWIKKQDQAIGCPQEMHLTGKEKHRFKMKVSEKIPSN
jgi:hypothetical protein